MVKSLLVSAALLSLAGGAMAQQVDPGLTRGQSTRADPPPTTDPSFFDPTRITPVRAKPAEQPAPAKPDMQDANPGPERQNDPTGAKPGNLVR